MKTNFSLLFYMKKQKNYKGGFAPIYLRITVNGKRSEATTGRNCDPKRWNAAAGLAYGTKEEIKAFNAYLDDLQSKITEIHRVLIMKDEIISADGLRDKLIGKSEKSRNLVEIFKEHNRQMSVLVGKDFAKGTLINFQTTLKHTVGYLKWKYRISDVDVKKIDHDFVTGFDFYLRSEPKCANNSTLKNVKNFKKIIRICQASGWIDKDPFVNYKGKTKIVDRAYLTTEELQLMANKDMATDRLTQVRDIFLFCCFTGLAYADVKKLHKWDIVAGIDSEKLIAIKRQKTDTPSRIPLLPTATALIQRYAKHPQCESSGRVLPVLSNQKMNSYLKEIADVCSINKPITFHIARHTFATTITLLNGVPIESVSKMLGHTNIQTTQHYAKISDIKVGADMAMLKRKLSKK